MVLNKGTSLAPGLAFSPFYFVLWQLSKLKLCWIGLGLWKTLQVLKFKFGESVLPLHADEVSVHGCPQSGILEPEAVPLRVKGGGSTTAEVQPGVGASLSSQLALRFQNHRYFICSHSQEMARQRGSNSMIALFVFE